MDMSAGNPPRDEQGGGSDIEYGVNPGIEAEANLAETWEAAVRRWATTGATRAADATRRAVEHGAVGAALRLAIASAWSGTPIQAKFFDGMSNSQTNEVLKVLASAGIGATLQLPRVIEDLIQRRQGFEVWDSEGGPRREPEQKRSELQQSMAQTVADTTATSLGVSAAAGFDTSQGPVVRAVPGALPAFLGYQYLFQQGADAFVKWSGQNPNTDHDPQTYYRRNESQLRFRELGALEEQGFRPSSLTRTLADQASRAASSTVGGFLAINPWLWPATLRHLPPERQNAFVAGVISLEAAAGNIIPAIVSGAEGVQERSRSDKTVRQFANAYSFVVNKTTDGLKLESIFAKLQASQQRNETYWEEWAPANQPHKRDRDRIDILQALAIRGRPENQGAEQTDRRAAEANLKQLLGYRDEGEETWANDKEQLLQTAFRELTGREDVTPEEWQEMENTLLQGLQFAPLDIEEQNQVTYLDNWRRELAHGHDDVAGIITARNNALYWRLVEPDLELGEGGESASEGTGGSGESKGSEWTREQFDAYDAARAQEAQSTGDPGNLANIANARGDDAGPDLELGEGGGSAPRGTGGAGERKGSKPTFEDKATELVDPVDKNTVKEFAGPSTQSPKGGRRVLIPINEALPSDTVEPKPPPINRFKPLDKVFADDDKAITQTGQNDPNLVAESKPPPNRFDPTREPTVKHVLPENQQLDATVQGLEREPSSDDNQSRDERETDSKPRERSDSRKEGRQR